MSGVVLLQSPIGLKMAADRALAAAKYQVASETYAKAAIAFDRSGDPNAAAVLRERSARWRTEIRFFRPVPIRPRSLARHEPAAGCLLGANVERERRTRVPAEFSRAIGKNHALFFMYRRYGMPFPREFADACRRAGAGVQIAWEPRSLRDVRDDLYLRRFAEDAARSGVPVFLRFASEMNGRWTPYHGDPAAYVAAFRLVARRVREIAPNVAMVWSVNEIPDEPIPRYYPGADAVDWVGVNFYSVIYRDADRARPAEWRWPTDALDGVYRRYASRHPIMVAEWAATHRSVVDNRPRPDFAIRKIHEFYGRLPYLYPRVKAVSWLSFDATEFASNDRRLNDYSLFDEPSVSAAYGSAIAAPWYLSRIGDRAPNAWAEGVGPGPVVTVTRTFDPNATVRATRGDRTASGRPGTPLVLTGTGPISATVTRNGRPVATRKS